MQLVEQHIISKGDPRFHGIDEMAFASKNLWNLANYYVRQSFIFEHSYLNNAPSTIWSSRRMPTKPCLAKSAIRS